MKENDKIGYVYLTTNLLNGKQYVGQHLHDVFDTDYKGSGHAIKNAINKYGWGNFKCEVICWCSTQTQLNEVEDHYIKLLGTMSPKGYNLRGGGSKGRFSKETRKNMSKAKKKYYSNEENRKKQSQTSKKCWENEEYRKKRSESQKGRVTSEETRKKQSETVKKYWKNEENRKKQSEARKKYYSNEENRKKQSESQRNHPKLSKKVYQYTLDGVFVNEWASAREIERVLGYANTHISACCNDRQKSAYDFVWKHKLLLL